MDENLVILYPNNCPNISKVNKKTHSLSACTHRIVAEVWFRDQHLEQLEVQAQLEAQKEGICTSPLGNVGSNYWSKEACIYMPCSHAIQ